MIRRVFPPGVAWAFLLLGGYTAALAAMFLVTGPKDGFRFFPGDPPAVDMALPLAGFTLCICAVLFMVGRRVRLPEGFRPYLLMALVVSAAVFAVSLAALLYRFSSAWAPVRMAILDQSTFVLAVSKDRGERLSLEAYAAVQEQLMASPIEVPLSGFGAVRLRMMSSAYPFVGVDFGEGRNAIFDPRTMFCLYAD